MLRKVCALFLIYITALYPTLSLAAAPQIPGFYGNVTPPVPTQLPVLLPNGTQQGIAGVTTTTNHMIVNQTAPQAVIDWSSFNIGANAWTHFDQKGNKNWVALNRIYDKDPTQIFGKLTADGKIYLINRNGILFGPGSQVNVHSLVASSLNMSQNDFLNGVLKFQADPGTTPGVVSNHGTITTDDLGSVFLLGSQVENYGSINAPVGQIGLAAGSNIEISSDPTGTRSALIVNVKANPGSATNGDGGSMIADTGLVGMYGQDVTQNGLIRSVTAVRKNGQIELFASNKVTMGPNSLTASPITDSTETVDSSFTFNGGKITIAGLDPASPANPQTPAKRIELYGAIDAPSGTVAMQADQRIYLESGSSINVGGSWLDESASTNAVNATLNSVTLNNDYGQKGSVLQGQSITVDPASGSAIGNIQGSLTVGDKTALERSVQGGTITLQVNSGDLIAKQGALLDFTGGGIRYGTGAYATTKLLAGNTVYDISTAPEWLTYSKVLGDQKTVSHKFGKTGEYVGLYFGGGAALLDLQPGFVQGADAGKLSVSAPHIVFDAQLDASATAGIYQTQMHTLTDSSRKLSVAAGTEMPLGGSMTVGAPASGTSSDLVVSSIVVKPDVDAETRTADILPISPALPTTLSARTLSSAGLSTLSLYADTGLTIEKGAALSLNQGGSLTAVSRQIVHQGEISAPGGSVSFSTNSNITSTNPLYQNIPQNLLLDSGSSIDVAGVKIDNFLAGKGGGGPLATGRISGGTISLTDDMGSLAAEQGNGVVIKTGATLDVSGGYLIGPSGKVSGGDAGSLTVGGHTVIIDGTLRGLSLPGSKGGKISLHADEVNVQAAIPAPLDITAASQIPADRLGTLSLGAHQMDNTGFSQVALSSENNVTINAQFSPSMAKMAAPVAARGARTGQVTGNDLSSGDTLSPDYVGVTSVTATTGVQFPKPYTYTNPANYDPQLVVATGAGITVAPGGTVSLQANGIQMNGTINAPAGQVNLTATQDGLTVAGQIKAAGYVKPGTTALASGLAVDSTTIPGGSVTLTASQGSLTLAAGSLIDVSGAGPVSRSIANADGTVSTVNVGSDAGSVSLAYATGLTFTNGTMDGLNRMPGTRRGTLTVSSLVSDLNISGSYLDWYTNPNTDPQTNKRLGCGFDALTLKSTTGLNLTGAMSSLVGRSLTLDAPVIRGDGSAQTLVSPWITLRNTNTGTNPAAVTPASGSGSLNLVGGSVDFLNRIQATGYLDVLGAVQLSGFKDVALSGRDIRLSDLQYGANKTWQGSLNMAGDLALTANRIYPTTLADFTINVANYTDSSANKLGGNVRILPNVGAGSETVLSAGGRVAIKAATGIDMEGVIEAPMGQIELDAPTGRVYLADKSVLSTAGTGSIAYGALDDVFWTDKSRTSTNNADATVTAAPAKSVTINGTEVITRQGSTIDVSGGGSIFGYQFIAGTEGSTDPFTIKGRYIIMPDQSVSLPGNAIYLSGGNGIKAGVYSVLPEQYAFLPGAMVVTDLGTIARPGTSQLSPEGYPLATGFATVNGTTIASTQLKNYSIRSAADVMKEGHFSTQQMTAGDAGTVTLHGTTTVVSGDIKATALSGYNGGAMDLSGTNVTVSATSATLPQDFSFASAVPADQVGTLQLSAAAVSGKGLKQLNLGDPNTATVTVQAGSTLEAQNITLSAQHAVVVEHDAQVQGVATASQTGGTVTLSAPAGKVTVGANAVVNGTDSVTIDAHQADLQGRLTANNGLLNLLSDNIYFVSDAFLAANPGAISANQGISITNGIWSRFAGFSDVALKSNSDIAFQGDFNLQVSGQLTMDTARIGDVGGSAGTTITAKTISLQNSGSQTPSSITLLDAGSLTMNAEQIGVGRGNVQVTGFKQVNLNSAGDLTLRGDGSLTVDKDLNLSAARITTASASDSSSTAGNASYIPANFTLDASNGNVVIAKSTGTAGTTTTPGGSLTIKAQGVDDSGIIAVPSGNVTISASGTTGIVLHDGASILAQGSSTPTADPTVISYAPGGVVTLTAATGPVTLGNGSTIDVSAVGTGDAGIIALQALKGGVTVAGTLTGRSTGGKGGSLTLATDTLGTDAASGENRFTTLAGKLAIGGFTGDIDLRTHTGDVTIDGSTSLKADNLHLTADSGSIVVNGSIDVSGNKRGGNATLLAGSSLVLASGAAIDASGTGTGASGGDVVLGIAAGSTGTFDFQSGAVVDVSGQGSGAGGTVTFRAPRNGGNTGVNMSLAGSVSGAAKVDVVGVRAYNNDFVTWQGEATNFMSNVNLTAVKGTMSLDPGTQFTVTPGVEITSAGDMTLNNPMNLTNVRYGVNNDVSGELTLRAGGNLAINGSIIDSPAGAGHSWGINLAAGADLASADYLAVNGNRQGNLTIGDGIGVYSKSAPVRFASGGNTTFYQAVLNENGLPVTLGTSSGPISGRVGGDLVLFGGVIQSATGDIDLKVGGDLYLKTESTTMGSVRTTGAYQADPSQYWNYAQGGNIAVSVKGSVLGGLNPKEWDHINDPNGDGSLSLWSASYLFDPSDPQNPIYPTAGIATMGGGDVSIRTGGSFTGQSGTFGAGNLSVYAGGDIKNAHFLVKDGTGVLNTMGNIGNFGSTDYLVLDAFAAQLNLTAQGNIELGTVLNPTIIRETRPGEIIPWDLLYSAGSSASTVSSVSLAAATGDVTIYGTSRQNTSSAAEAVLPATLQVYAGHDINLKAQQLILAPSPYGDLRLTAGNDINGTQANNTMVLPSYLYMSDMDPQAVYGEQPGFDLNELKTAHSTTPVHRDDPNAVTIKAGGNITNLQLHFPKRAEISAGGNIKDIYYSGQNLAAGDLSQIVAGGNITFSNMPGQVSSNTGIDQAGPGSLLLVAGDSIDLGTTKGIKSNGNSIDGTANTALGNDGASLMVVAGTKQKVTPDEVNLFFNGVRHNVTNPDGTVTEVVDRMGLRDYGIVYEHLKGAGEVALANRVLAAEENEAMNFFYGHPVVTLAKDGTQQPAGITNVSNIIDAGNIGIVIPDGFTIGKVNYPATAVMTLPSVITTTDPHDSRLADKIDDGVGRISMTNSQISTIAGKDDIFILARSQVDVGRSTFNQNTQSTGIFTAAGGAINAFTGGDLNVNESRLMTFMGGGITLWSDLGNINAGRGSRTTISAAPPKLVAQPDGTFQLVFQPPAVGSGIRAVTFDPDGLEGPLTAPPAGDVFLFAPNGNIDAGEAGIAGTNIFLAAKQVLNSINIAALGNVSGSPPPSDSTVSIGALGGAGAVSAASNAIEQNSTISQATKNTLATDLADDFIAKWLDVKVLSFDDDASQQDKKEKDK